MIPTEQMPPCMKRILRLLADGTPAPHDARTAFASFALNSGIPPEKVGEAFMRQGNYDAEKTRKQVASLVGLYTPNCVTMKQRGLCTADMPIALCAHIKSPQSFQRIRAGDRKYHADPGSPAEIPLSLWVYHCKCGEDSRPLPGPLTIKSIAQMHLMSVPDGQVDGHDIRYMEVSKLGV